MILSQSLQNGTENNKEQMANTSSKIARKKES